MHDESSLLPISALQHLLFCERQCALIHIEQLWADNQFTAEGNVLHERTHEGPDESRPGVRITRGLPVRSLELGLSGQCDVVEFHVLSGEVLLVEYKRGKPKAHAADEVQLCAQALCLEEMLHRRVENGALFYGQRRRRTDVLFDEELRALTRNSAIRLHALITARVTPTALREKKCESCSLLHLCLPDALRFRRGAAAWFDRQLHESVEIPCANT
jgi:CRISPR-associated exonuclease Cas4